MRGQEDGLSMKLGVYQTISVITGVMFIMAVLNSWIEFQSSGLAPSTTHALKIMLVVFLALYVSLWRIDKIKRAEKAEPETKRPAKAS